MIHRDEIHGDVRYDDLGVALLDTSQLQRLGRVYQLGYGHLVYRGGTHTRLSHAMGAYFTASRLVTALQRNYEGGAFRPKGALDPKVFLPRSTGSDAASGDPDAVQLANRWTVFRHLVCWAALLHDIGHVPLGHTLEDEFSNIYESHDSFISPRLRYLWLDQGSEVAKVLRRTDLYPKAFRDLGLNNGELVLWTVMLICTWKERIESGDRVKFEEILNEAIASGEPGIAPDLLQALDRVGDSLFHPYMADLVANTISADYLDYLRRDPHNLGLDVLRDDRVVSHFWVGQDGRGQARMALTLFDKRRKPRLDTTTMVVELVRQRFRFAEIVYYHKTKVAASAMLAKVFHLLGKPDEVPSLRHPPTIADAEGRVAEIFAAKEAEQHGRRLRLVRDIRRDCTPSSLLDAEIGDESLGLLMRARAVEKFEKAIKDDSREDATNALRGVALLDGLAQRKLYKTVFTMNANRFRELGGFDETPKENLESELRAFIEDLRGNAAAREQVEQVMVRAAGWEEGSILLYVPGRKSQAKGIETGALTDGVVVTLGAHDAVKDDVDRLSKRYEDLWRFIVVVHPDYAGEVVALSKAVDALIADRFPQGDAGGDLGKALRGACWFPYLPPRQREAAEEFVALTKIGDGGSPRWEVFEAYGRQYQTCSSRQHGWGAALLARVERDLRGNGSALDLIRGFGDAEKVGAHIEGHLAKSFGNASIGGASDGDVAARTVNEALEELAGRILGGS